MSRVSARRAARRLRGVLLEGRARCRKAFAQSSAPIVPARSGRRARRRARAARGSLPSVESSRIDRCAARASVRGLLDSATRRASISRARLRIRTGTSRVEYGKRAAISARLHRCRTRRRRRSGRDHGRRLPPSHRAAVTGHQLGQLAGQGGEERRNEIVLAILDRDVVLRAQREDCGNDRDADRRAAGEHADAADRQGVRAWPSSALRRSDRARRAIRARPR